MRDEEAQPANFEGDAPAATSIETLHDRRELALVALERTRMPMVVSDARHPDNPVVLANRAFLKLTGYEADEVIGRNCRFLQGPGTDPAAIDIIRNGLGKAQDVQVELLNYRKDGSTFWNQLAVTPIKDEAGNILYYFGSQKDVSARRRAEASEHTERLLLMEVDHRAMNALALVQSFVRLGRAETVEEYAWTVQHRVDALAKAHRALAQNGWSSVTLEDLIQMSVPAAALPRVALCGPSLAVSSRVVQPVALAIHELIVNALTHGALSRPGGLLKVDWHAEEDHAVVRWSEEGSTISQTAVREGFGLGLIRGIIERQLHGTFDLAWKSNGLVAALSFTTLGRAQSGNSQSSRSFR